jgi:hypothetical protein
VNAIGTDIEVEACKLICASVDDDGTDLEVLRALRSEKGVLRANSISCLRSTALSEARTKPGKLPQPAMGRLIEILVPDAQADDIFDFVCNLVITGDPGNSAVWQSPAPFCTGYAMPEGVPDEGI